MPKKPKSTQAGNSRARSQADSIRKFKEFDAHMQWEVYEEQINARKRSRRQQEAAAPEDFEPSPYNELDSDALNRPNTELRKEQQKLDEQRKLEDRKREEHNRKVMEETMRQELSQDGGQGNSAKEGVYAVVIGVMSQDA